MGGGGGVYRQKERVKLTRISKGLGTKPKPLLSLDLDSKTLTLKTM